MSRFPMLEKKNYILIAVWANVKAGIGRSEYRTVMAVFILY